jgi:hypothetical protein
MPEQPIFIYEGELPSDPAWYLNVAFARAMGPLERLWFAEYEKTTLTRYANKFIPRQEAATT